MTEDQQRKAEENLNQPPNNIPLESKEDANNTGSPSKKSEDAEKEKEQKCKIHPNVIINTPNADNSESLSIAREANRIAIEDNVIAKKANKWTVISIIINVALVLITLWALNKTRKAVNISKDALTDSRKKDVLDSANRVKYDSIDSVQREITYIKDSSAFSLANQTFEVQVKSIQETKKQFKVLNQPYLQIKSPSLKFNEQKNTYQIAYTVENLGNYPAKAVYDQAMIEMNSNPTDYKVLRKQFINRKWTASQKLINAYLIKGSDIKIGAENPTTPLTIYRSKVYKTYFSGIIIYKNLLTNTLREYRFTIELKPNTADYSFVVNDNVETPVK